MYKWTLAGMMSAGACALALGACGGSEVASIPPVAPVVQPAPQPDMFASVPAEGDDDSGSSDQSSGDTGKTDQAQPAGKTDEGKPGDKTDQGKADKKDAAEPAAKKEEAKPAKSKKAPKAPKAKPAAKKK